MHVWLNHTPFRYCIWTQHLVECTGVELPPIVQVFILCVLHIGCSDFLFNYCKKTTFVCGRPYCRWAHVCTNPTPFRPCIWTQCLVECTGVGLPPNGNESSVSVLHNRCSDFLLVHRKIIIFICGRPHRDGHT